MKEQKTAAMAFRNGCALASPSATVAKSALASEDSSVGASGREVFAITCWARQGFPTEEEAATFYAGASRVLALAGRARLSGCRLFVGPISVVCGRTCNSVRSSCGQRLALPAVARDSLPVFRARALERRPRRVGPDMFLFLVSWPFWRSCISGTDFGHQTLDFVGFVLSIVRLQASLSNAILCQEIGRAHV